MDDATGGRAATQAAGMLCPNCRVDLVMSERQGVEIDYCPRCRGVWLDRGELDKILERTAAELAQAQPAAAPSAAPSTAPPPQPDYRRDHDRDGYRRDEYRHDHKHDHKHHKRRRSFLDDLFD